MRYIIYEGFIETLSHLAEDKSMAKTTMPGGKIAELWTEIRNCADNFDIKGVNKAIDGLKTVVLSETDTERLSAVIRSAEAVDYDAILKAVQ